MKHSLTEDIQLLSGFFSVISDETRLLILYALKEKPLCVSEICLATGKSQSLISHQLVVLKNNNLVESERKGNFVYYKLKDNCVESIIDSTFKHVIKEGKKWKPLPTLSKD